MCEKWREKYPGCQRSEQNLADQVNSVFKRKVFTDVELELFKRESFITDSTATPLPTIPSDVDNSAVDTSVVEEELINAIHQPSMHHLVLDQYQHNLRSKLMKNLDTLLECSGKREHLPTLKSQCHNVVSRVVVQVNVVIQSVSIQSLEHLIDILYCAYKVVCEECGTYSNSHQRSGDSVQPWKKRLQNRIVKLNRDLSQLRAAQNNSLLCNSKLRRLEQKYHLNAQPIELVCENVYQQVKALSLRLK